MRSPRSRRKRYYTEKRRNGDAGSRSVRFDAAGRVVRRVATAVEPPLAAPFVFVHSVSPWFTVPSVPPRGSARYSEEKNALAALVCLIRPTLQLSRGTFMLKAPSAPVACLPATWHSEILRVLKGPKRSHASACASSPPAQSTVRCSINSRSRRATSIAWSIWMGERHMKSDIPVATVTRQAV